MYLQVKTFKSYKGVVIDIDHLNFFSRGLLKTSFAR